MTVGPVPPGGALRFWQSSADVANACLARREGPCWLFGGALPKGTTMGSEARPAHADIGVPFQALRNLVSEKRLPAANVSADILSTNSTRAELSLSASGAAALYVHLTSGVHGQFSESGFHLLAGETRHVSFAAWHEHGDLNGSQFAETLHVLWLNDHDV
eukprot:SAG31_NODE_948_length_10825_cov_9.412829_12_plen_160_part_00